MIKLTPSRRALLQRLVDAGGLVQWNSLSMFEVRTITTMPGDYIEGSRSTGWRIIPDRLDEVRALLEGNNGQTKPLEGGLNGHS